MGKKGTPHRKFSKEEKMKYVRLHLDEHVALIIDHCQVLYNQPKALKIRGFIEDCIPNSSRKLYRCLSIYWLHAREESRERNRTKGNRGSVICAFFKAAFFS